MTAQEIATAVRRLLIDEGATPQFSTAYILDLINEATPAILSLKPTALTTTENVTLGSGVRQTLPTGTIYLHDIIANVGSALVIRRIDEEQLDVFQSNWRSVTATIAVEHYMYDETDPKSFQVYPPNNGSGSVTVRVTKIPSKLVDINDTVALKDDFKPAYIYYVAYRIMDADSDEINNENRADRFYSRFAEALGVKIQNRMNYSPNARAR